MKALYDRPSELSPGALLRTIGLAIAAGVLLMGLASLGQRSASLYAGLDADPLRATDARLARVYVADPATHSIRVLNVRNGVSEIARVPVPKGRELRSIRLDGSGNWLFVDTDAGRLGLATLRLAMQDDQPQVASQSAPKAAPPAN